MLAIEAFASGSAGNCYRVTDGGSPILIECGVGFERIRRWLSFRTQDLAGCLVSHEHQDHAKAVNEMMRAGVDCYMSQGTAGALEVSGHRLKTVRPMERFEIGPWGILPFEAQHDAAEPLGFLLANGTEKLLYLTDSYYCKYRFQGLSHLMVECNYCRDILRTNKESGAVPLALERRLLQSHFSLEHLKEFLAANDLSRVREIWLIHLSDGNSDAARCKREVQELTGKEVHIA